MEVLEVSLEEAKELIQSGHICDAKTIMAVQYWELHKKIEEVSMGKPLLTDEMIERANRGEKISGPLLLMTRKPRFYQPLLPVLVMPIPKDHGFSQETLKIQVEPSIHKSRRIENTKRNIFNSKLNKILFAVIFLLILLVLAMKLL